MIALANPQRFHGAVEQAFPGERRRRLWRMDPLGGKLYLMILSEDAPDLSGSRSNSGRENPGKPNLTIPCWSGSCQTAFGASD